MPRHLPSLTSARAFEAAARLGSFTLAAEELGMTQSGVSRHIKVLEGQLGQALFVRHNRRIELTAAARELAPSLTEAFDALAGAFARVERRTRSVINLTAAPSLHPRWLLPRLAAFQAKYPELEIRLDQSRALVDLDHAGFDAALRSGDGRWPGLEAHKIVPFRLAPLCSPALFEGRVVTSPKDLLGLPLLEPDDPAWPLWFEAAGFPNPDMDKRPALRMSSRDLYGQAALAGRGVALLSPELYSHELSTGELVQPFPAVVDFEPRAYWLVSPASQRRSRSLQLLRNWLTDRE
jgi:LysR family transcriptional regulator, glycine cleavage system transcriptional activator